MSSRIQKILTGLTFLAGLALPFYRFRSWGLEGYEGEFYHRVAYEWMKGNFVLTVPGYGYSFFRPLWYGLLAVSMKIFGVHDWTGLLLNFAALAGCCFLIYRTSRRRVSAGLSWSAVLLFLFLPIVHYVCRITSPHLVSAFFVLLGLFLLEKYQESGNRIALFFSALSVHAAAATHPDLAFLTPGFLFYFLVDGKPEKSRTVRGRAVSCAVFISALLLPLLFYQALWNLPDVFRQMNALRLYDYGGTVKETYPLFVLFLSSGLVSLMGLPLTLFLYAHVLYQIYAVLIRRKPFEREGLLLLPPLVYFLLFDLLLSRNVIEHLIRVMVPLLPFFIIYMTVRIRRMQPFRPAAMRFLVPPFFIFAVLLPWLRQGYPVPSFSIYYRHAPVPFYRYQTVYRFLHDRFGSRLRDEETILVAPAFLHNGLDLFNLPFYFDGKAVALSSCDPDRETFEDFIRRNHVRYVYIGRYRFLYKRWRAMLRQSREKGKNFCLTGTGDDSYAEDVRSLVRQLKRAGAQRVLNDPFYGAVYELPAAR